MVTVGVRVGENKIIRPSILRHVGTLQRSLQFIGSRATLQRTLSCVFELGIGVRVGVE